MQIRDMSAGDNIEVIELAVKSVGQGKLGKPPNNTPYQHLWLTDGTGDIRFSLFGEDVNKIQEHQTIKIISAYIKEYPAGSGKLQLSLSRDNGEWQIVSGDGPSIKSEDITPAPIQIVSSDARDNRISRLACLKAAAQLYQGIGTAAANDMPANFALSVIRVAESMHEWAMEEPVTKLEAPSEANGDSNWSWFWTALKRQGYTPDDVHKLKDFGSVKQWMADNKKTLTEALATVLEQLRPDPVGPGEEIPF